MTGSLKAGYSPVFRRRNANGVVEMGLGFRSTVSVQSIIAPEGPLVPTVPRRFEVEDLASVW